MAGQGTVGGYGLPSTAENRKALMPLVELVGKCIKMARTHNRHRREASFRERREPRSRSRILVRRAYLLRAVDHPAGLTARAKAQARDYRRHMTGYVLPGLGISCLWS